MEKNTNHSLTKLIIILAIFGALTLFCSYYVDWLWFSSLNFQNVFAVSIVSKIVLYSIVFFIAFLFIWLNLQLTRRFKNKEEKHPTELGADKEVIFLHPEISTWQQFLEGKTSIWIFLIISLVIAYMVSSSVTDQWIVVQQYINRVAFGTTDPCLLYTSDAADE